MEGTTQNSDEFIWRLFAEFAAPASATSPSPVVFETWASDADTFTKTPAWPDPAAPKKFQTSRLLLATRAHSQSTIDVKCAPPGNAAVGGFPTTGTPSPCIAEEVKRNRTMFDYIVRHSLNTQEGLQAAFKSPRTVDMPTPSVSVKGDWVPVSAMLQWIPRLGTVERVRQLYYTNTVDSTEYALVSLHVASRQNKNWVWGTFEHAMPLDAATISAASIPSAPGLRPCHRPATRSTPITGSARRPRR
ncbi:hypothetical protein WME98_25660 [Sorangium sp. So ce296]|uniref:hypothetical protein n=1 Tax=Sorangium sp. So ce296 TaxID=3133296 RepID=UPI003F5DD74E